jgi:predicted DNA-binding transcriptional regulator YafY
MRVSSLEWMAGLLAGLACDFTINEPEELRESVENLGRRLTFLAGERR